MEVNKVQLSSSDLRSLAANLQLDSKVNLFETPTFTQGSNGYTVPQNLKKEALFGNKLIGQDEEGVVEGKTEGKSELPETKKGGLHALSRLFQHKQTQLKNYLTNINDNVNEYDAAVSNALKYLPSKEDLDINVTSNPRIKQILADANLPVNMNYDNLKTIKHSHVATTVQFARVIGKELGMNETELQETEVGAALHDIGKTLIPAEILNKKGKLTTEEREVVNLHSVLGYEILKSTKFGTNVAEIARDHHDRNSKNTMAKIVRAADVYSAMREKRSYKEGKSHGEAMEVLQSMNIDSNILAALDVKYGSRPVSSPLQTQVSVA